MADTPKIPDTWTEAERWVWERIAAGKVANLNARDREQDSEFEDLDPKTAEGWGDTRRLSVAFLQTILTERPFVEATPFKGVKIFGALIDGDAPLDLAQARLERLLWLDKSRLLVKLSFWDLQVDGMLSLDASFIKGAVALTRARILGNFHASAILCEGDVDLSGAKVEGQLSLSGSTFGGTLYMNGTQVAQGLFMGGKATFKASRLVGAKVYGQLDMSGSTFEGKLTMVSIMIGESLYARSAGFSTEYEVDLLSSRIESDLDLSGATLGRLDLTGTTVAGEMRLGSGIGHKPANWESPSRMVLRNTSVGAIQDAGDEQDCWPETLELEGFAYRRLGGLGSTGQANMGQRPSDWYCGWLGRDKTYSPQPYEQVAKVLREMGYPGKADDVLYAGRKRAHGKAREDKEWGRWLGMALLRWTIGFGLGRRYFRCLYAVALFTIIGIFIYANALPAPMLDVPSWLGTGQPDTPPTASLAVAKAGLTGMPLDTLELVSASLDQLLPIVTLDRAHEKLTSAQFLPSWALFYFYFQKLVGWVLGSFLIAGFAGLTQKN